jgi:hypothetical protein
MVAITRGLDNLDEPGRRPIFVQWVNPTPDREEVLRFVTDVDDVAKVSSHEFYRCLDGVRRSFVCCRDDRDCALCARGHPLTENGWAYVALGELEAGGTFSEHMGGPYVLKLPIVPFWAQAKSLAAKEGGLRGRPYGVTRGSSWRSHSIREVGLAFESTPLEPAWASVDLADVIGYYASPERYASYVVKEETA